MAITVYDSNNPMAVKKWSAYLSKEIATGLDLAPLIGTGPNNIIRLYDETSKGSGDVINYFLQCQLVGSARDDNSPLVGNEESPQFMMDRIVIDTIRHATQVPNKATIFDQRIPFSLRDAAKEQLKMWFKTLISRMFFIHACGYDAPEIDQGGTRVTLSKGDVGHNVVQKPSTERVIYAGGKNSDDSITDTDRTCILTLDLIDEAVHKAQTSYPPMAPVQTEGGEYYVLYMHPTQAKQLRSNTGAGQWLDITKYAYASTGLKNPIFTGSLGIYNGVILRVSNHVTHGVKASDNTVCTKVRRAVFLGSHAVTLAFGRNYGPYRYIWHDETKDHNALYSASARTIMGLKKTQFKKSESDDKLQDFGTIVISTSTYTK